MKPSIAKVDLIVVTCERKQFLEPTIVSIQERTRFPYRLILVNNGSKFDEQYLNTVLKLRSEDICIQSETNIGFGAGMNEGFKRVETDYFVTTCDDIFPPDLEPCWLERLVIIFDQNPEYGGINCRCQKMRNYRFDDESMQVYEHSRTLASSFRIQRKSDITKVGGVPIGAPYESKSFTREIHRLGLKTGCATHIHCNHLGVAVENKGYPQNFDMQFKRIDMRPWPEIGDNKTNALINHICPPWPY